MSKNALAQYLETRRIGQGDFAKSVGADPALVSQWVNDIRRPGLDSAFAIQRETGGEVTAEYWSTRPKAGRREAKQAQRAGKKQSTKQAG